MQISISGQNFSIPENSYLVLAGPTGVGKTDQVMALTQHLPVEVVSADSRQVYIGMDIGTATPAPEYLKRVPHHFINELTPDLVWSAGQFYRDARQRIRAIRSRGNFPVVVGGTGLYLEALGQGLFKEPPRKTEIRNHYEAELAKVGAESLWERLREIDPDYAAAFHFNDVKKLVRAFEIFHITGMPPTQAFRQSPDPFDLNEFRIILARPREILYTKINERVKTMLAAGLIEECQALRQAGYSPALYPLKTIGYRETFQFLDGDLGKTKMIDQIQQHTRNYAKRQLTWFRNHPYQAWIELT